MADKTSPEQEPSIEEILASIRQIISDDDEGDQQPAAAKPAEQPAAPPAKAEPAPVPAAPKEPEIASKDDIDAMFDAPAPAPAKPAPESTPASAPAPASKVEEEDDVLDLTEAQAIEEAVPTEPAEIDLAMQDIQEQINNSLDDDEEDDFGDLADQDDEAFFFENAGEEEEAQAMPQPIEESILSETARQATLASMAKLAGNMPVSRPQSIASGGVTLEDIVRDILNPMLRDWMDDNLPPMVERIVQKELEKLARRVADE